MTGNSSDLSKLIWRSAPGVSFEPRDHGAVLTIKDTSAVHFLNATAAVVFLLCDGANTSAMIADEVAKQFGLAETPNQDVGVALSELRDKGLILTC